MSKIGIYLTGLGQSFQQESVEKYAARFKNEMNLNSDSNYHLKVEKVNYTDEQTSTVVSIINEVNDEVVYKFYEFKYKELLTERFNKYNILIKNFFLFFLVVRKSPIVLLRLFKSDSYRRTGQTFYVFAIFFLVSVAIIFLLPSVILFVSELKGIDKTVKPFLSSLTNISAVFIPFVTFLLLVTPQSKTLITTLATEFACADSYIQYGAQSQVVLGNLDLLIEYIQEKEEDSKIHMHSYSFGTLIAIDLLFPIGNVPARNSKDLVELLITIGTPYEFINAYYPNFYSKRSKEMDDKIKWVNVFSISDALATNFRKDATDGAAESGIKDSVLRPINVNYEIASFQSNGFFNFFTLHHIKAHKLYWDESVQGQSCMRKTYNEMVKLNMV
ncbi:hypothetical protein [Flavobacterium sp. UBA7682]|uniref:hypothetical protein n=1 Tax=Flavobacterium sp. UBA7682 TaxID=1946560 RepID=UPI0025BD4986|nr:hypothetical protein [Flavobacterium sp. UBA7682]